MIKKEKEHAEQARSFPSRRHFGHIALRARDSPAQNPSARAALIHTIPRASCPLHTAAIFTLNTVTVYMRILIIHYAYNFVKMALKVLVGSRMTNAATNSWQSCATSSTSQPIFFSAARRSDACPPPLSPLLSPERKTRPSRTRFCLRSMPERNNTNRVQRRRFPPELRHSPC